MRKFVVSCGVLETWDFYSKEFVITSISIKKIIWP